MYSTYIQRIEIALLSDPWCIQLTLNTDSRHSNTDKYSLTICTYKLYRYTNEAAQVRAGQRGLHQQPSICSNRTWAIFTKISLDTHTHTHTHHLFGQWKKLRTSIACSVVFIYKREMSCPGTCAVPFLCHPTCVGAHYSSYGPPPPPPPRLNLKS